MNDAAIEVDRVWKKFRRGEVHDSLRDLVPALGRWALGRRARPGALGEREFWALKDVSFTVRRGDRIAQLVVQRVEQAVFELVDVLPGSARGGTGFGSSGTA